MARKAAIVGVADTPLKNGVLAEDGTVLQIQARAAKAARSRLKRTRGAAPEG